jgi:hypothetical protein
MIKDNIAKVKERIAQACLRVKRDLSEVKIVVVTKGRDIEITSEPVYFGFSELGENRVQETVLKHRDKRLAMDNMPIIWHMIGHLQTNKVRDAVRIFDLIQSVDSLHLLAEINKEAAKINKVQDILLEVKTSLEATKFGLKPEELLLVAKEAVGLKNVRLKGLMTIAPYTADPEEARTYFKKLRELRDDINSLKLTAYSLQLSMGMSDDFEVAIEEGSTMVRLGRAIFD